MQKTITVQSAVVTEPQMSKAGKPYQNQIITDTTGETYNLFYNPKFDKAYTIGAILELSGEQNGQYVNWKVLTKSDKMQIAIDRMQAEIDALKRDMQPLTAYMALDLKPAPAMVAPVTAPANMPQSPVPMNEVGIEDVPF